MHKHAIKIATELSVKPQQVQATLELLDGGAAVPFISRYRKELTGSLDDEQVITIRDRVLKLEELDKRREAILKSIEQQEQLTPVLKKQIEEALTLAVLEDIYLPYRPKRKTRATTAKARGLEPLALFILAQSNGDLKSEALKYVNAEKEVNDYDKALQGSRDIIAEKINEDAEMRKTIRELFMQEGMLTTKVISGKEQAAEKYKDYFSLSEPIKKIPSHRLLAIRRAEKELFLIMDVAPDPEIAFHLIRSKYIKGSNESAEQVKLAISDGYKRLLKPSIETEIRLATKQLADQEAIKIFSENLRQLLLSPPLGQKSVLALDPGFRTGCKLVCLDRQGKLLQHDVIYPNEPKNDVRYAGEKVMALVEKFNIEAIVIGNGTAGRETERFVRDLALTSAVTIAMVNESGASVYSASAVAREEFPNEDVTVRGAVSIGRRLMDPLAELVKIDPKSIGVGQYQHDVDQNELKKSLDDVVMSCVNGVGVELNTASKQLLTYVSGLGPQLAENIVKYREDNGPFESRAALKKVPKLGNKSFEQAAGFLRINDALNILDRSGVHPERYDLVDKIAFDMRATVAQLVNDKVLRKQIDLRKYTNEDVGLPTLKDIFNELEKPSRDPRAEYESFSFMEGVNAPEDLKMGMKLRGIVTNITKFGAFVDIGVHQDGLVHVSHLSDAFVSDPAKVIKLQQKVQVTVMEIDVVRKRISLSMKSNPFGTIKKVGTEQRSPKPTENPLRNKEIERQKKLPEGDLQSKLESLRNKFKN
jgi:protein Tex